MQIKQKTNKENEKEDNVKEVVIESNTKTDEEY